MPMLDLDQYLKMILRAPVYDVARETPLDLMPGVTRRLHNQVWLKREDMQPVFSYKIRGAYNMISALTVEERARGVITASAGNHAQGVALAAGRLGIAARIVMPKTTPEIKIGAVRRLGAEIVLVSPPALALDTGATGLAEVSHDLDEHLGSVDVLYMLRVQRERMTAGLIPSMEEYSRRYALDASRAARLRDSAIVMHPGPMNRGVEMLVDPADLPGSRILDQVTAGIPVRMAVLATLIGSTSTPASGGSHGR